MNRQLLVETATLAGEIMLRSGAETFRVEDTMTHILRKANTSRVTPLALTTSILVTLEDEEQEPVTIVRRVKPGSTNLSKIVQVNDISRKFCEDELTLEEASLQLKQIHGREYRVAWYNLATIGTVMGFVIFFGGSWLDILMSVFAGGILALLVTLGKKVKLNSFIQDAVASAGVAFFCVAVKSLLLKGINLDTLIISSIMPMVPGVAITNAVRDSLQGDYISGGARVMEAFMKATAIAVGVGVGMSFFKILV